MLGRYTIIVLIELWLESDLIATVPLISTYINAAFIITDFFVKLLCGLNYLSTDYYMIKYVEIYWRIIFVNIWDFLVWKYLFVSWTFCCMNLLLKYYKIFSFHPILLNMFRLTDEIKYSFHVLIQKSARGLLTRTFVSARKFIY